MSRNIVKVKSETEMAEMLAEFIHLSVNMRRAQDYWHHHYGHAALAQKKKWEGRMDAFLTRIGITGHTDIKSVRVMVNGEEYNDIKS